MFGDRRSLLVFLKTGLIVMSLPKLLIGRLRSHNPGFVTLLIVRYYMLKVCDFVLSFSTRDRTEFEITSGTVLEALRHSVDTTLLGTKQHLGGFMAAVISIRFRYATQSASGDMYSRDDGDARDC